MHASKGLIALTLVALASTSGAAQRRDTRLADAAERRDGAAIQALVKQKTDLNAAQPDGATALHWVAHWDDVASAELLLKSGANVNAANDAGVTPLALACENGSAAMVEALLKGGANPNAALLSGETALMTAARSGNAGAVKALIAKGANVNATESTHGQTALMWAVSNQHPAIVQTLVENGADVHARSEVRPRAVHTGNRFGDRGDSKGALTMDLGGFTPLLFAARQGDLESARLLLAAGATANEQAANGASALVVAAHSGQGAFAKLLLERGADPNAAGAGYSALHAAVLRGDVDLVKALLARGANPNTPIAKGTPSRYYSKDWALNVNALGGATPLWQASRYGDVPIMRALAAAGANITFTMPDGTTTLMAAVAANNGFGTGDRRERYIGPGDIAPTPEENERLTREVAAVAIELGADVNAASQTTGDTALHLAASQALDSVVQLLVDKGANIEAANKRGLTPLGAAVVPRPRNPLQIDGPDRRKSTAELLRRLGAKEPDPKTLVPPAMPGRVGDYLQQQQQREQRQQQQQQGQPEQKPSEPKPPQPQ
ncbi:MAG TPA: ankyrin repeat domain-containing protein [Vicinamibacterales bacterium]|jgi:ankyrin repeat protein